MDWQTDQRSRFENIWNDHRLQVLAYFLRRSPGPNGEDACAETFLVVWRRLDEIPPPPRTLLCLYGIARKVSAFGHDGYHLVLEVPGDCNSDTSNVWAGGAWGDRFYQAEGQIVEYWFLDVDGTTVMVEATRPPETDQEMVTELNTDLDTVLDTLVLTP